MRGDIWPFNLNPVILELIGPDGKSLGLRILTVGSVQSAALRDHDPL